MLRPVLALALLAALAGCDAVAPGPTGASRPTAVAALRGDREPPPDDGLLPEHGWRWIGVDGMRCRSGSTTGYGVRTTATRDSVLIVLDSGGTCTSFATCFRNAASYSPADFDVEIGRLYDQGLFEDRPENPFRGWTAYFVPYCTGDLHLGRATGREIESVPGTQDFVGYANLRAFLAAVRRDVARAETVVLAGVSAGGFGATGAYDLFAQRLSPAPVHLLSDAGPFLPGAEAFDPAFEAYLVDLFDLGHVVGRCGPACEAGGLGALLPTLAERYPDRAFGLSVFEADYTLRTFYGSYERESLGCAFRTPEGLCEDEPAAFASGLEALRRGLRPLPNAGVFTMAGDDHGSILRRVLYNRQAGGTPLWEWMGTVAAGGPVPTVGDEDAL